MIELRQQLRICLRGRVCLVGVGSQDHNDDGLGLRLAEAVGEAAERGTAEPSSCSGGLRPPPNPATLIERRYKSSGLQPLPDSSDVHTSSDAHRAPLRSFRNRQAGRTSAGLEAGPRPEILLAGCTPENHLGRLAEGRFDQVVFLDAVDFGGAPGSVVLLDSRQMCCRFPQVSTHRISLGLLARFLEAQGSTRAWLLGVQPASLATGAGLSPAVQATLEMLCEMLVEALEEGAASPGWYGGEPQSAENLEVAC